MNKYLKHFKFLNRQYFSEVDRKPNVSLFKLLGIPIFIYVSAGFAKGYLDNKTYHEVPAQIINVERENDEHQKITYRYTFNNYYLFEKNFNEDTSSFFGPKKLTDYQVGDIIKIKNSKRNPQLSTLHIPIFQPLGYSFFYDYDNKGIEIKYQYIPTDIKEKIEERKSEIQEKEKWKERALLSKPKFEKD
eukprot:TRINITY_DN16073_c0_g1_i1.p1 TRINITY_DN16073_c0_g1~~TRINITY_DN16073_c0_g1_i1.p1  ORF type:complete len:189 (+),score=48.91 TRINITY_DN16073_c0_g1_i1:2-568(+)